MFVDAQCHVCGGKAAQCYFPPIFTLTQFHVHFLYAGTADGV